MGVKADDNPLNHDKYTDADAAAAVGIGAKADDNALNHDKYTDAEAIAAMGDVANNNDLNHNRYTDAEAIAAVAVHDKYTNAEAVTAMGVKDNANGLNHDRYTDAEAIIAITDGDLGGSVTATNFTYSAIKTSYISLPGIAFTSSDSLVAANFSSNQGSRTADGDANLSAAISIPHNAIVTEFTVLYTDIGIGASTFSLYRYDGTDFDLMASIASGAAGTDTDDTIDTSTVDQSTYSYMITANLIDGHTLKLVRITYTMDQPSN